jgi:hypothetical protein
MIQLNRLFYCILFICISLCLPLSVHGQPSSAEGAPLVDQLTQKLAIEQRLGEAPENIRLQFEQNPLQLPPKKNTQMLVLYGEAYTEHLLIDNFKAALQKLMKDDYTNEISEWLAAPATESVTGAQQEFYTLQGKRKRIVTMYEMDQESPSQERTELISTLTDASAMAESSVESSVIILRSVIEALNSLSEKRNFTDAQLNAITNNFRTQMQSQASQQLNSQLMVMYHNTDNAYLESYVDFWQSDAGQWLDQAIGESMQSAYRSAAENFLESVDADSEAGVVSKSK